MLANLAAQAAEHSLSSAQIVIFVFSAIIVAFWKVVFRLIIAILAAALIAVLLSGAFVIFSVMHR